MSYKNDMARELSISFNTTLTKSKLVLGKSFDLILDILSRQGRVELRNFGVFEVVHRKSCVKRNPKNGEVVHVPSRYKVKFKPSKQMIQRILEEERKKIEIKSMVKK